MERSELQDPYEQADPNRFDVSLFARGELYDLLLITDMSNWSMNIIVEDSRELAQETGATQAQIIRYYKNIAARGVDPIDGSDPLRSLILDAGLAARDPVPDRERQIALYSQLASADQQLSEKEKMKLLNAFRPLFAVAVRWVSKVVRAVKRRLQRKFERLVRIARSVRDE
jgi:hypothetical protein